MRSKPLEVSPKKGILTNDASACVPATAGRGDCFNVHTGRPSGKMKTGGIKMNTNTKSDAPKRRGRPPGQKPDSRLFVLPTRVHESEAKLIEDAARREGVSRTEWMREALLKAARRMAAQTA